MVNIPETQSAWMVVRRGHPSKAVVLQTDVPVSSKLEPGEVMVKVEAAALNPIGYKLMRMLPSFLASRPLVAEHDLAGTVVLANGTEFSNGDPVFGWIPMDLQVKSRQGALAQYARLPASYLAKRPSNITAEEAAGVALCGLTAHQAIFATGKLEPGQTLFVNGGSTAVGAYAIQLAKARGCKVVASASGKNEEFVRGLGADEFIDYTAAPLHAYLSSNPPSPKYHLFLEAVGLIDPALYTHSEAYLAPGGTFVTTGPLPNNLSFGEIANAFKTLGSVMRPAWLGGTKRAWKLVQVKNKKEELEELSQLIADGKLKPPVDSVFAFSDAQKAWERLLTARARGKVVVKVDESAT